MIKLVILDVDGVMTDGKKYYGIDGMPFAKTFADKDWTSIKRFKALGIPVIFLTGDANINEEIGKNRNIPTYLSRGKEKADFIPEFEKIYNCTADDMLYVGDDLFDLGIMRKVGYAFSTKDAPLMVKDECITLPKNGGDNIILSLFEFCEQHKMVEIVEFDEIMGKINELDKKEVF